MRSKFYIIFLDLIGFIVIYIVFLWVLVLIISFIFNLNELIFGRII